jgi:hypothetical protein
MKRSATRRVWPTFAFVLVAVLGLIVILLLSSDGSAKPPAFSLTTTPLSYSVRSGGTVTYMVTVTGRDGFEGVVRLNASGAPAGVTVLLQPGSVQPTRRVPTVTAKITVGVTTDAQPGNYRIVVAGRAGRSEAETNVTLVVVGDGGSEVGQGQRFTISGAPSGQLHPGTVLPVNLVLTNPDHRTIKVTRLTVSVAGTGLSACSTSNFAVTQYTGTYPLLVPARQSRSLQSLAVPTANYPQITLLNLAVNQDACKGATITLNYAGTGSGA